MGVSTWQSEASISFRLPIQKRACIFLSRPKLTYYSVPESKSPDQTMADFHIALLRHAKAIKNVEGRHGGPGSDLLPESEVEIDHLVSHFARSGIEFQLIMASPRVHCEQTAQLMAKKLGLPHETWEELSPISLGILDGLTKEELHNQYPEIAVRMDKWRSRLIEIHELSIPGMDDAESFYKRGQSIVGKLIERETSVVVVATRSILVLLGSVLQGRLPGPGGGYKEIPWPNCGVMVFLLADNQIFLSQEISTVFPG